MSQYDAWDIRQYGRTLYGPELRHEFPAVDLGDLKAMTLRDLQDARARYAEIGLPLGDDVVMNVTNTWNYIAWLCRALYSARHPGMILAKSQAMNWLMVEAPAWTALLEAALCCRFAPAQVTPARLETLRLQFGAFFAETGSLMEQALAAQG